MGSRPPPPRTPLPQFEGVTDKDVQYITDGSVQTRDVPCGKCTACCQGDAIFLHLESGDNADIYVTEVHPSGRLMLAHQPNRDCIYLDRATGCTIHESRPVVCREMDCALIVLNPPEMYSKIASPAVIRAGKKRVKMLRERIKRRKRLENLRKSGG